MDLRRLDELREYHKINPPLHIVVARYLGVGETPKPRMTDDDLEALMSAFPEAPKPVV